MKELQDVLPRRQLVERFGTSVIFEEYGKDDLGAIAKRNPHGLHGVAANVWNRIVFKSWARVNPLQLARYFQKSSPNLHHAISEIVGAEVIRDIYFVKGWKAPKSKSNLIVELLVAWVYRCDLQLGDITFIDPGRPLAKDARGFGMQTHKGLGLLPVLMKNLGSKAEELRCEQLTLTAATRDQVTLFSRYGFVVEDSFSGRSGMNLGFGIPMERDV